MEVAIKPLLSSRAGSVITGISFLAVTLLTGVEPVTDTAFWVHIGLMTLGVLGMLFGILSTKSR
mgnify:FL=1